MYIVKKSRLGKLAVLVLMDNPQASATQIAKIIGCSRIHLYRLLEFRKARATLATRKRRDR